MKYSYIISNSKIDSKLDEMYINIIRKKSISTKEDLFQGLGNGTMLLTYLVLSQ